MNGWIVVGAMVLASVGSLLIAGLAAAVAWRWAIRRSLNR